MTQNELSKIINTICTWLEQGIIEDLKRIEQGIPANESTISMAYARATTMSCLAELLDKWLQIPI